MMLIKSITMKRKSHGHNDNKRPSSGEDMPGWCPDHGDTPPRGDTPRRNGSVNSTADYEELSADMIPEEDREQQPQEQPTPPQRPSNLGHQFHADSSNSKTPDSKTPSMTSTNTTRCSADDSVAKDAVSVSGSNTSSQDLAVCSTALTSVGNSLASSNSLSPSTNSCQSVPISPVPKPDSQCSATTVGGATPAAVASSSSFSPVTHSTPFVATSSSSSTTSNGTSVAITAPPAGPPTASAAVSTKEVNGKSAKSGSDSKKKKSSAWYNVLSPTYKSKSEDFKRIFKDVPNEERLIIDYSCALQKDILIQGRLYVSQNFICFYANIFRWETVLTIKIEDITSITKERTARVIPNAIQIATAEDKYFFSSFGARDKTHIVLFRLWHNCLLDQPLSANDQWRWVHHNYGDDLHLTSSDDDYTGAPAVRAGKKQSRKLPFSPNGTTASSTLAVTASTTTSSAQRPGNNMPERSESAGELLIKDAWITSSMQHLPPASSDKRAATTNGHGSLNIEEELEEEEEEEEGQEQDQGQEQQRRTRKSKTVNPTHVSLHSHSNSPANALPMIPDIKKSHLDASTDPGNTSTDDDQEVFCEDHSHKDILCINEVFDMSVNDLYSTLFTNSIMFQRFMQARKTSDLEISEWTEPDTEGIRSRELTYTLSLSHAIGPNFSYSTEKQTCHASSTPGCRYTIDAEFNNTGIPYGDSFYVINRYCLNKVGSRRSRLHVTSEITFRKKPFGLVKNYIQKTATQGILDNFAMLGEHLREECLEISGDTISTIPSIAVAGATSPSVVIGGNTSISAASSIAPVAVALSPPMVPMVRKRCLRKKRFPSIDPSRNAGGGGGGGDVLPLSTPLDKAQFSFNTGNSATPTTSRSDTLTFTFSVYTLTRLLIIIMISMLLFNGLIFLKMNSLEGQANSYLQQDNHDPLLLNKNVKRSNQEWRDIVAKQRALYTEDIGRWREKLFLTLQQLDSARETVLVLSNRVKHIADHLDLRDDRDEVDTPPSGGGGGGDTQRGEHVNPT